MTVLCVQEPALWHWLLLPVRHLPGMCPTGSHHSVVAGEEPADSDPREHTATSPLRLLFPPDTGRGSSQEMGGSLNEVGHHARDDGLRDGYTKSV